MKLFKGVSAKWLWTAVGGLLVAAVTAAVIVGVNSGDGKREGESSEWMEENLPPVKLMLDIPDFVENVHPEAMALAASNRILSFAADGSELETVYLLEDMSTGIMEGSHRFADFNDYWTYYIKFDQAVSDVKLELALAGQYRIEASSDGVNWAELAISQAAGEAFLHLAGVGPLAMPLSELYVRFSDAEPTDGFGPSLFQFTLIYTPDNANRDAIPSGPAQTVRRNGGGINSVGATTERPSVSGTRRTLERYDNVYLLIADGGDDEQSYLLEDHGTGIFEDSYRFADAEGYWVYRFQFADGVHSAEANLDIGGHYRVEASPDGINWTKLSAADGIAARSVVNVGLDRLLSGGQTLYLRFADQSPQDGFGAWLWSLELGYTLKGGLLQEKPAGIGASGVDQEAKEGEEANGNASTGEHGQPGMGELSFAANGSAEELAYLLEDRSNGLFEGAHRFADEDAYWIYGFQLPAGLADASLKLDIGGQYLVEGSIDGEHWQELLKSENTTSIESIATKLAILQNTDSQKLYLRFSDRDKSDGFGVSLSAFSLTYKKGESGAAVRPISGPHKPDGPGKPDTAVLNRYAFAADGGAAERKHMVEDKDSSIFEDGHRFADGEAYWTYYFKFPDHIAKASLELELAGQYRVLGSIDGSDWRELARSEEASPPNKIELDLGSWLTGGEELYLKFADSRVSDGFGPGLWQFAIQYELKSGKADPAPKGVEARTPVKEPTPTPIPAGPIYTSPPGPPSNHFRLTTSGGHEELAYLYEDRSTGIFDTDRRYADNDAYWVYGFRFADGLKSARLSLELAGQYVVSGSMDGTSWTTLATAMDSPGRETVSVDLSALLTAEPETLFIRFSDRDSADGFGPALWSIGIAYVLKGGQTDSGPTGIAAPPQQEYRLSFDANGGQSELEYMYKDRSSGIFDSDRRYADNNDYWIYGFRFADGVRNAQLRLELAGQYAVSGSTDGTTWTALATAADSPGRETVSVQLDPLLAGEPETLYIRFSDRDTGDGFGPALWSFEMTYELSEGQQSADPTGIAAPPDEENSFTFGANGGSVELEYLFEDGNSDIFDNDRRFADNNAYWIYGFRFADGVKSAQLNLELAGQYVVSGSTDGVGWTVLATATDSPGRETVNVDLASLLTGEPETLFIRFSDRDAGDGFGPALWMFEMRYVLRDGQSDERPLSLEAMFAAGRSDADEGRGGPNGGLKQEAAVNRESNIGESGSVAELRSWFDSEGRRMSYLLTVGYIAVVLSILARFVHSSGIRTVLPRVACRPASMASTEGRRWTVK